MKNTSPKFCTKCGEPLFGKMRCECGWKPHSKNLVPKLLLVSTCCLIAVASCLAWNNWYTYFPDIAAADRHLVLANDMYYRHAFQPAEDEYRLATSLAPNRSEAHYRYAWNLYQGGKPGAAVQEMLIAEHLSGTDERIETQLADMMRGNQQFDESAKQYEKCAGLYPTKATNLLGLQATCVKEAGKTEQALTLFQKIADKSPKNDLAWNQSVECFDSLGKKGEAIKAARQGLKVLPNNAFLHYKLGTLLSDQPNKDDAITELRKSAELDPSSATYIANYITNMTNRGSLSSYLIPLQRNGRSFTSEVVLNEKIRVVLIVDSGADSCIIPTKTAAALGIDLSTCPTVTIRSVTGMTQAQEIILKSVRVGAATATNVRAFAYDYQDEHADGLLGMTYFEQFTFSLQADKSLLSLTPVNNMSVLSVSKKKLHKSRK
jgi:clan AA aspartic protease (TIGR02281 family)